MSGHRTYTPEEIRERRRLWGIEYRNRKEGMGLAHAATCLCATWKDLKRCIPEVQGTFWDDEIKRITTQMSKRAG